MLVTQDIELLALVDMIVQAEEFAAAASGLVKQSWQLVGKFAQDANTLQEFEQNLEDLKQRSAPGAQTHLVMCEALAVLREYQSAYFSARA